MTAHEVVAAIVAAGGRLVLDPNDPRILLPRHLRPLADEHRAELRALLRARARLVAAGVSERDAQVATEAASLFGGHVERVWSLDPASCPRRAIVGCSRCGSCDPGRLYARLEAGPLCADCWKATGQPWR